MADQLITGTTLIEDKRSEKGEIWSVPGVAFKTSEPDLNDVNYNGLGKGEMQSGTDNMEFICPVDLPNGVTIKNVVVYGDAAAAAGITWTLSRLNHTGVTTAMASAAVNTEDTSISNATVNNEDFLYFISSGNNELDTSDTIFGARIKYEF